MMRMTRSLAMVLAFAPVFSVAWGEADAPVAEGLAIEPSTVVLSGHRATSQLIATANGAEARTWDLTRQVEWSSDRPEVASVTPEGLVTPRGDGQAVIIARSGSLEARAEVTVRGMNEPATVSFRRDVIPALSQAGCNTGACHGTPTGKGGFRLSLRGYLPDEDFRTLTREASMRRLNRVEPADSLLLTKPLGMLPHEGGKRLARGSKPYEMIHDWIAEGAKDDPESAPAVKLEMSPGSRILYEPAKTQQVAVRVHDGDGGMRDVTPLCYFDSSNPQIAEVDAKGHVTFKTRGEVAIIAHYLDLVAIVRLTHLVEVPGFVAAEVPGDSLIDRAVFAKLNHMRVAPSERVGDAEFLRRVTLDAIGRLPSPEEVQAFEAEQSPGKREQTIDRLLQSPEFLDFWTLKLADVLRSNSRLIQNKGTHVYQRWIRESLERDKPLDQFVRELLTAEGSSFGDPAANYYRVSREPESSVETTAQLFLGVRIQCAKCHNHPFEKWTQDDYYGFAAFFSRVKQKKGTQPGEEVIFSADGGEVRQPRTGKVMKPKALGGPVFDASEGTDPRESLAAWLTTGENPFFAKSVVNRVWYHLMGRGIVEPVDDFRDSNPASNDELLDGLAADFASNGFSLRRLVRQILNSRTYQLSARTNPLNSDDAVYFSHAYPRLLPAEVLLDAISTVTGTQTAFENLPAGTRAVQIPDGKMENAFLKTFGRPARELACECERESDSNLSQALQLIGGETVNSKLRDDNGRIARLAASDATPEVITRELYLVALGRAPTDTEVAAAADHFKATPDRRQAAEDVGWVLINSKEFLFRH